MFQDILEQLSKEEKTEVLYLTVRILRYKRVFPIMELSEIINRETTPSPNISGAVLKIVNWIEAKESRSVAALEFGTMKSYLDSITEMMMRLPQGPSRTADENAKRNLLKLEKSADSMQVKTAAERPSRKYARGLGFGNLSVERVDVVRDAVRNDRFAAALEIARRVPLDELSKEEAEELRDLAEEASIYVELEDDDAALLGHLHRRVRFLESKRIDEELFYLAEQPEEPGRAGG